MKSHLLLSATALPLCLVLAGCATADPSGAPLSSTDADAAPLGGIAQELEVAVVAVESGRADAMTLEALQAIVDNEDATSPQVDEALLLMSRAHEQLGQQDEAIAAVETILRRNPAHAQSSLLKDAHKRLRKLLTGKEEDQFSAWEEEPIAPFAHALAPYFEVTEDRQVTINLITIGGNRGRSSRLGTFNVGDALREQWQQECPLCEGDFSVSQSSSASGSWTSMPTIMTQHAANDAYYDNSLVVLYVDLGDNRIPARYDHLLPMPSAELAAQLEQGKGLVVAKERPDAPPVIVVAAPRDSQLGTVEEVLAGLERLPLEPITVDLPAKLTAKEIQNVVRSGRGRIIACYNELLDRAPEAAGRVTMAFTIAPDGSVPSATPQSIEGGLDERDFLDCMEQVTKRLAFPPTLEETSVTYPWEMSPQ